MTDRHLNQTVVLLIAGLVISTIFLSLIMLSLFLDGLLGLKNILPLPLNIIVAAIIGVPGAVVGFWCVMLFVKVGGTPLPIKPPPRIVENGLYSRIRNPMMTGSLAMLFGLGFLLNSISMVLIVFPVIVVLAYIYIKFIEEPEIEKRLGQAYIDYRNRVPMFIPKLRPRAK